MITDNSEWVMISKVAVGIDGFNVSHMDLSKLAYRIVKVESKDEDFYGVYICFPMHIERKKVGIGMREFVRKKDLLAKVSDEVMIVPVVDLDRKMKKSILQGQGHRGMPRIESLD